jgi:hypothetical protein
MSSQSRATRENQKKQYDERLQARQKVLEARGMAATDFRKDKVYEHLKARHRAIVEAIAVIDASLARKEQPKAKDAQKAAPAAPAPAEKKQKKEKPEKAPKAAKAAPADSDK